MYIRMTGGRDRGEVKDFPFDDAQALIKNSRAVSVDFNDADPLAKKNDFEIRDQQSQLGSQLTIVSPQKTLATPPLTAKADISASTQKTRKKS